MKILVTGGSGFIGSYLIEYLKEKGNKIFNYDIREGHDITDYEHMYNIFETNNFSEVYHVAAQAFLGPGEKDPYMDIRVNEFGMINLLKCLEKFDIPMVFTSSGAVYGHSEIPHREDLVCVPVSNYGVSKLAAENYLRKWVITEGVDARIVRFSSVYGPGRKHGAVNIFINQGVAGKPITVFGRGHQTRDFQHIEDAIRGLELALQRGNSGEIFNIGLGEEHSVVEVAKIVQRYVDVSIEHIDHELSPFDLPRSWFDITKAGKLGYKPRMGLKLGIQSTIFEMQRE